MVFNGLLPLTENQREEKKHKHTELEQIVSTRPREL